MLSRNISETAGWRIRNNVDRNNRAIVVGKLGIKYMVISAEIKQKRENNHKDFEAWLYAAQALQGIFR